MGNPVKGRLVDADFTDTVSRVSAEVVPFGVAVVRLANGKVQVPDQAGLMFDGVSAVPEYAVTQYEPGQAISVRRKGPIWVHSETAVDPTKPVYFRHTARVMPLCLPGDFLTTSDDGKADLVARAKWASVTLGAGLAILEINGP